MFISFEGGEGAGKTTLIESLYRELISQGKQVLKTRAPGGTSLGNIIREALLHKKEGRLSLRAELFLFLADRAEHVEEVILPALTSGTVVLCDRFNDSTIAYQGAARGFGEKWVETLALFATANVIPDITFYLDLDPKNGFLRVQNREKDRIEKESLEFHNKVRYSYLNIAKKEPHRFYVLEASRSPEEVYRQAAEILSAKNSFNLH